MPFTHDADKADEAHAADERNRRQRAVQLGVTLILLFFLLVACVIVGEAVWRMGA